jgi:hypothetical protein
MFASTKDRKKKMVIKYKDFVCLVFSSKFTFKLLEIVVPIPKLVS